MSTSTTRRTCARWRSTSPRSRRDLAGLEVADFIVQAAGASVRLEATHPGRGIDRRDFQAVFRSVPKQLASYIDVRSATWQPGAQ